MFACQIQKRTDFFAEPLEIVGHIGFKPVQNQTGEETFVKVSQGLAVFLGQRVCILCAFQIAVYKVVAGIVEIADKNLPLNGTIKMQTGLFSFQALLHNGSDAA